ncbi:hypothetical protein D3C71_1859680 [compost metagenome]
MVGVLVRPQDGVKPPHIRVEKLLAQVRRSVDQDADATALPGPSLLRLLPLLPFHQDGRAHPLVFGVRRVTGAPAETDHRNAP